MDEGDSDFLLSRKLALRPPAGVCWAHLVLAAASLTPLLVPGPVCAPSPTSLCFELRGWAAQTPRALGTAAGKAGGQAGWGVGG